MRWRPEQGSSPRKILVIQLRRIGDSVLVAPVLDALRERWPEARIHLLTEYPVPDLFLGDPRVHVLWARPPRSRLAGLARNLRRERYDLVFDFQSLPVTAFLAWASGGFTVGFRKRFRGYVRGVALGDHRRSDYTADHKLDLLRAVGIDAPLTLPRLFAVPDAAPWEGLPEGPRVALVPVSPWPHKRWAPEAFAETARLLHAETGAVFVLAGGPGEDTTLEAVAGRLGGVPHRSRTFARVRELTAFLAGADLFLGNDNGPRHIAAALGIPTLGWFNEINPTQWTPPGPGNPVIWDPARAGGRPYRKDLDIVAERPEAAAKAAARLLRGTVSRP